ncbi:isoprenylcysteine carboxylmethyltransferase family protein [bacterium]|nr:isoprenylcysteine carboxylmethyltransferase family protein [bacterium]
MASEAKKLTPPKLILTMVYLLIYPLGLLWLAGDWKWVEGWLFSLWFVALCAGTIIYLYFKDPALLAERYRKPGASGEAKWDQVFVYAIMGLSFAWFAVMPLDAQRFHWTAEFPLWLKTVGAVLLLLSSFFLFRAFRDNTFLSPLVRIQREREQQVVSTGVYGFVRHPMYLGATCMFIGAPLFLSSLWGLAIGLLMTLLLMVRIVGEEALLLDELAGYDAYRQKVRYRLLPYIW